MNRVVLMGRLTRDPDVRYSQGEQPMAIARYTLAVDRRRGRSNDGENSADFISCVAFGKAGEFAEKYFHKGTKIAVSGRIQTGSYVNKDGVKVYTTDVVVDDQEFAESKNASQGQGSAFPGSDSFGGESFGAPSGGFGNAGQGASDPIDGFMNIPEGIDEELPFS
ncbi:MAG: single-stranded DNA-binding protein [Lachnospiraceae bacterium]|nr:single-stranded DNA-binding protein [Lachnospiraceae bacterium]